MGALGGQREREIERERERDRERERERERERDQWVRSSHISRSTCHCNSSLKDTTICVYIFMQPVAGTYLLVASLVHDLPI